MPYKRKEDTPDSTKDDEALSGTKEERKEMIERLRARIIEIVEKAGKGHLGTSLSSLDAIVAIRDRMDEDDIFISSKGHDALAQYAVLAESGILDVGRLDTFRNNGGLPGHPTVDIPGIEANTGSLGMGLSKALGFALDQDRMVYVLLGDGEMMEGQNWEAALAAANYEVNNIVAIVDYNQFSQDGPTELTTDRIVKMFVGAGWSVAGTENGNDLDEINLILDTVEEHRESGPWLVVLITTKGKGTEFEGTVESHFGAPGAELPENSKMKALGLSVKKIMENDEDVILVTADTARDLHLYDLREKFPDRVFDFGIAEQNAVSFASARALMGQKPIFATYACFIRRAFEQIYNQLTEGTAVVYIGTMAGPLDPSGPGISHQSLDDAEYIGNLMDVIQPAPDEIYTTLKTALKKSEPTYVRISA